MAADAGQPSYGGRIGAQHGADERVVTIGAVRSESPQIVKALDGERSRATGLRLERSRGRGFSFRRVP